MKTCPDCNGQRERMAFVNRGPDIAHHSLDVMQCRRCNGTGFISDEKMRRYQLGQMMRAERLARAESLYKAASDLGCLPSELSKIERGEGPASAYN